MSEKTLSEEQKNFAEKLFRENYKLLSKRIYNLLRNVDPSATEDCLSNLFLTLCLSIDKVMVHENPVSWMFLTARFICLKHIRSIGNETKKNIPIDEELSKRLSDDEAMEDRIIDDILWCQWENQNVKKKLLRSLNSNEQKILELKYQEKLSNAQIGEKLGKSENAIRFTIYYIKKKITQKVYSGKF